MSYKVIGAAAVVEMDDGNPDPGTGRRLYLDEKQAVPEGVKKSSIKHLLAVGLIAHAGGTAADEDDVDGDGPIPAKSATKDVWVDYAVSQGADRAEAEASTKDDLIAKYGAVA